MRNKRKARNNNDNWYVNNVEVSKKLKGFDFYAKKDFDMATDADYGLIIWMIKSRGTLNNAINLLKTNKKTIIYYIPEK